MTRRRRPVSRALLLALLAALLEAGCVSTAPNRPAPAAKPAAVKTQPSAVLDAAAASFRGSLNDCRGEGRREVDDIVGVYANLPAEQCPGIAGLRRDIVEALSRLEREKRERLTAAEVDALTVHNPHFWRAWYEFDPRDSSLLMLHSSLLMEAGEVFRASTALTIGVQSLPLNLQERVFWFKQQARVHFTAFRRLDELREREKTWGRSGAVRAKALARMVDEWPSDGFALELLLQSRAGFKPGSIPEDDRVPIALPAKKRAAYAPVLAQLQASNPVAAARYAADQAGAKEFGRLWGLILDEDRAMEQRELVQFAAAAKHLGLGELALLAQRAVAARRGLSMMAPGDLEFAREALPLVLPAADAAAIVADLEDGRMPGIRLTRPAEEPTEVLKGMDPAIHPLLADHAVREYARESLWISAVGNNPVLRGLHLRLRAIVSSNVGRFEAALTDIDEALKLKPDSVPWAIDRANILSKMGRAEEAEALFAKIRSAAPDDDYLRSTCAIHQFGTGHFAEAEALYRAAPDDDSNRAYEVIFGYLAGLRRGAPDAAWLVHNRLKTGEWPAPIQRYLLGEIDRTALLAAARDPLDLRTTEQQCEAYFSLGEHALAAGDTAAAVREFENCVQSGIVGFIEYDLARRELARLVPPSPSAPAPGETVTAAATATPQG